MTNRFGNVRSPSLYEENRSIPRALLPSLTTRRWMGILKSPRPVNLPAESPFRQNRRIECSSRIVLHGPEYKDIAAALAVGEETVKTHVTHVLSKLHVENRAQAIVQALKRGLVSLDERQ
jgi:hypothetical protein